MCSLVDKWQTMIEAHGDVKTTEGYSLHLLSVGSLKSAVMDLEDLMLSINRSAKSRKKMMEIMTREVQTNDLKEVVNKLIPDGTGRDTEQPCPSVYPLHDVFVRKVKMPKKPKFKLGNSWSFTVKVEVLQKLLGVRQMLL